MNNPSPLLPQGATPPREKSSLYFKVLMILTVHVVVIGGMLLQGCKDTAKDQTKADNNATTTTPDTTAVAAGNSNPATAPTATTTDVPPTVNPNISNAYAATTPTAASTTQPMPPAVSTVPGPKAQDLTQPAVPSDAREYVIASGDTLGKIARKNGVSLKTLKEANPGVEATKLRIGQKIEIPAAAMAANTASGATPGATADAAPGDDAVYVVKSGDMLMKIAKRHGTSVKKIMAMNDLKTTSIRAGQKLKLPAPKTSSEPVVTPAATTAVPPSATTSTKVPGSPAGSVAAN
jgi:LysM repeat protein